MKKIALILCFITLLFSCGTQKPTEEAKEIPVSFEVGNIKEYHISCNNSELKNIYENYRENIYIPITITYKGKTSTGKMRVRGDTSRKDPKKSLKIKFDSLALEGVPAIINLNAEYADKTYIRQYLSSKMMQKSGQTAYNVEYIKLFINDKFFGLFLQVENMDKKFLERNKLSKKGNLYKATKDGACLSIFDDFDKKWEKKTNKKSDHNDLTQLTKELNNIPDNEFESYIKKTFEYDKLINLLALNMFLSNSSTYYHNYYLYHDLYGTGKWQMLPWDMDKTLSYYNWMPYTYHRTSSEWESDNPLVERSFLCKPIFKDIKNRIDELHNTHMNNQFIAPIINNLIADLQDIVPLDTLDKITDIEGWKKLAKKESEYFDKHYTLLQKQFNEQPQSFAVSRFKQLQTKKITFTWNKSISPNKKPITYILTYGTDFLLTDSSKTTYIKQLTDTFFVMDKMLPEGKYFWKITAFDGKFYTDGFNTKNEFTVKNATKLAEVLNSNLTLTKNNSPYGIDKILTIKKGVTLTIEKGVEIHLGQDAVIECSGDIIANGTVTEPILFIPNNATNDWNYIYLYQSTKTGYFKHVNFKEGTINCKAEKLTLDSCSMLIDKKDIGENVSRNVLIYTNKGIVNIKNSAFKSNGFGEGMVLFYSEIVTENCYFDNTPDAIEYIGVNKGIIRNNYVTNSPDDAIDLNACNNVLIEGNFLFNSIDKAISIGTEQYGASLKNIQIKNNLIVGNKTGIAIKDSSVAHISNNTLFKNKNGIYAYKKREDYKLGGIAYVKNTILEKNEKVNAYGDEYSKVEVNNTMVHNKVLGGKNNFKGDPKFINASNNNFHLRDGSPAKNKGDDNNDIGAFSSNATTISFSQVYLRSKEKKANSNWIMLTNNYNMPIDLSLYKIIMTTGDKQKEFIFPIGTSLNRLENIYITNNYQKFIAQNIKKVHVVGDLPKIKNTETTLQLVNASGIIIDVFSFKKALCNSDENITFNANQLNDISLKKWETVISK